MCHTWHAYSNTDDLNDNITSDVLKFAVDTNVLRRVNNDGDKQHLQNDLDKLVKRSEKKADVIQFLEM